MSFNERSNNELYHYGVLGMRWGIHRAKKYERKAAAAKSAGDARNASRYQGWANQLRRKHTRRSGGKKAVDYTQSETLGKTVVKSMLLGTFGTLHYNEARANGESRAEAAINAIGHEVINKATAGVGSIVLPRVRDRK